MTQQHIEKLANDIIRKHGQTFAYDFATWMLYRLSRRGYCIWQTFDKEDIQSRTGKAPTKKQMEKLQENMQNCFDYITQ